jgi:hypothetical protein
MHRRCDIKVHKPQFPREVIAREVTGDADAGVDRERVQRPSRRADRIV